MSPRELLEQLNQLDEHTRIEAKTASEIGKSVLETVCAFSNEPRLGGGWILLGAKLEDNALFRQYTAIGVPDPDRASRDLVTQCATSFNHPIRVQIESEVVNGRPLLAVHVPEAEPTEKPVFFQSRALPGAAFRRVGSADVRCTDDDLAVFYQDRRGETYDGSILRDADLDTLDPAAIAEYRKLRAEANPTAEELRWGDEELLHSLRCVSRDGGELRPTVAGLLCFGTAQALRRFFPLMRVDYIRVPGREWVPDPDQRFETIEMRAPLVALIRRARAAILDDLPKAFSLPPGQLHRRDIPLVPDRVIREAVVNAVMHRSYRVQGAVQIIRYANRIEIRNPGHSLVSEDRLGDPGSETRNPVIAAILHETNLAETKGSGIRVMRELMDGAGLTPPTFESNRDRNQFVVTLLFHHFLSTEDWHWLGRFGALALSDEEARALIYVRETGAIDNAAYRALSHVDVLNASQRLRRLRDAGLLEMKGKGADTYYVPTFTLLSEPAFPAGFDPATPQVRTVTPQVAPGTPQVSSLIASLPEALTTRVKTLPRRPARAKVERLLLDLCAQRAFSLSDLAEILGRNATYLLNNFLTPLVRSGKLERLYPDQPNHPSQAYRTPLAKVEASER